MLVMEEDVEEDDTHRDGARVTEVLSLPEFQDHSFVGKEDRLGAVRVTSFLAEIVRKAALPSSASFERFFSIRTTSGSQRTNESGQKDGKMALPVS